MYFSERDFVSGLIIAAVVIAVGAIGIWELLKWLYSIVTITISW